MDIILIHGMGRTPLSLLILRNRLRAAGFRLKLFAYSPTLESFDGCVKRFAAYIRKTTESQSYALVGHSLGTVLIRAVLPHLNENPPTACFFLAPPSQACRAAKYFANNPVYKLLMGEMGQLLASENFMAALPKPPISTRIYAGTFGFKGTLNPFGDEPNDGILTLKETEGSLGIAAIQIPYSHTFIMNSPFIAEDITNTLAELQTPA